MRTLYAIVTALLLASLGLLEFTTLPHFPVGPLVAPAMSDAVIGNDVDRSSSVDGFDGMR